MFLTTVRIRRARVKTLRELGLSSPEGFGDLVEVLAHGQVVAVATAPNGKGGMTILWEHNDVAVPAALIRSAVTLMANAKKGGLTERADEAA
jgi:hypothetical protein